MAKETNLKSWIAISLFLVLMAHTAGGETTSLDANYAAPSLVINPNDIFITNGYDVNVGTGGITIKGGGILDANSGVGGDSLITLEGDWSNSGLFAAGSSTVTFDGAGSQLINPGAAEPNYTFNNITISGPNVTIGGFVQLSGNFVFEKTTSTFSTGGHDVNVAGDWINNGIFNHDGGTVTFDGPSPQLIITGGTDPNKAFNNVRVTGAGVELELFGQTLAGDFAFESTGSSRTNGQDVNVAGSLTINSGTLDANDSNISVGGDWTNSDTFDAGTSTVKFTGDGNSTIAGTTATTFHNLRLEKADVNDRLFIMIDGCGSSNKTWVDSGTLDFSNADATFTCANDIEFSSAGLPSRLTMDAGDELVCGGNLTLNSGVSENITGGTIRLSGSFFAGFGVDEFGPDIGTKLQIDGPLASLVNMYEPSSYFPDLTVEKTGGAAVTAGTNISVKGDLTINSGVLDANGHDISVGGDWTNNDTFDHGGGTVTFDGSGSQTISTGGIGPNTTFNHLRIDGASVNVAIAGFLQISGNFAIEKVTDTFSTGGNEIHIGGNWTNNGTFNHDGGTVFLEGLSIVDSGGTGLGKAFYNLELNGSGLTLSGNDLDVDGNLGITSGTLDANGSDIYVGGDWNASGSGYTFNPSTGTVVFDGTGPQTFTPGDAEENNTFNNLRIDGSGLGVTLGGFVQLSGNFVIEKVSDTFSTGGNPIKVAGNWTNNGTFNHNGGTVTLDGSGTFGPGSDPFDDLIVSAGTRSLTGSNLTVDGKLTITSTGTLQATTGGLDIYTGEGGAIDVDIDGTLSLEPSSGSGGIYWYVEEGSLVDLDSGGTLALEGFDDSNRVYLRSSADGNQWYLNDHTSAGNNPFIDYVDVKDSDASSGNIIDASGGTNVDSGNNPNWLFTHTIFVDANALAPGPGDGTSWYDAYKYLQDALAEANSVPKPVEIWVAERTYTPDTNFVNPAGSGDRKATFQLISGVDIYGGFPSGGGSRAQRNWQAYPTILSGDLDGNDAPDLDPCDLLNHASRADNSFHVVTANDVNSVVLDGFTIYGGNANGVWPDCNGGGLYNVDSNITVARCSFFRCSALSYGGGYSVDCGPPKGYGFVQCCTFQEDCAVNGGGGMYNRNGSPKITNCTFRKNSASKGGGMYSDNSNCPLPSTAPTVTGCSFTDSVVTLYYGLLDGGGIYNYKSDPNITNCTFTRNSVSNKGGGIYNNDSDPNITNCIIWGNTDGVSPVEQAQIYDDVNSSSVVKYSCIEGLNIYDGNNNIGLDPFLADIPDQVRLLANSPCIDAGDNNSVPADEDIYNGGTWIEAHAWDLCSQPTIRWRIVDGDCNTTDIVDMGAYEFDWVHIGDFAGGCDADFVDFAYLGLTWLKEEGEPGYDYLCDISIPADSIIDELDLKIFTDNWLTTAD